MGESRDMDKEWVKEEEGEKHGESLPSPIPKSTLSNPKHENHRFLGKSNPHKIKTTDARKRSKQKYILVAWSTQFFQDGRRNASYPRLLLVEHL